MDLLKYLEPMKNLPKRFSNLAFWRDVRKFKDEVVNAFEYVDSWGKHIESLIPSMASKKTMFKQFTGTDFDYGDFDTAYLNDTLSYIILHESYVDVVHDLPDGATITSISIDIICNIGTFTFQSDISIDGKTIIFTTDGDSQHLGIVNANPTVEQLTIRKFAFNVWYII